MKVFTHLILLFFSLVQSPQLKSTKYFIIQFPPKDKGFVLFLTENIDKEVEKMLEKTGLTQKFFLYAFVAGDKEEFEKLTGKIYLPDWVSGIAFPAKNYVVVKSPDLLRISFYDIKKIFLHECAHIIIFKKLKGKKIPAWFSEGTAMYLAGEYNILNSIQLARAVLGGHLYSLHTLNDFFPRRHNLANLAYSQSASFMWFLMSRGVDLKTLLDETKDKPFEDAFKILYGESLYKLYSEWMKGIKKKYSWIAIVGSAAFFWFLISLLALISFAVKRVRTKRKLEELEKIEGEEKIA